MTGFSEGFNAEKDSTLKALEKDKNDHEKTETDHEDLRFENLPKKVNNNQPKSKAQSVTSFKISKRRSQEFNNHQTEVDQRFG